MFLSPSLYSTKKVSISRLTSTQYSHIHRRVAESRLSRLLLVRTWLRAARTIEESMWKWNMGTWRHSILWWVFKLSTFIQISSACWSRRRVLSPIQHNIRAACSTIDKRHPSTEPMSRPIKETRRKTFHPKSSSNTRNEMNENEFFNFKLSRSYNLSWRECKHNSVNEDNGWRILNWKIFHLKKNADADFSPRLMNEQKGAWKFFFLSLSFAKKVFTSFQFHYQKKKLYLVV